MSEPKHLLCAEHLGPELVLILDDRLEDTRLRWGEEPVVVQHDRSGYCAVCPPEKFSTSTFSVTSSPVREIEERLHDSEGKVYSLQKTLKDQGEDLGETIKECQEARGRAERLQGELAGVFNAARGALMRSGGNA